MPKAGISSLEACLLRHLTVSEMCCDNWGGSCHPVPPRWPRPSLLLGKQLVSEAFKSLTALTEKYYSDGISFRDVFYAC